MTIGHDQERTGIFAGDDPFAIARAWREEAGATEPSDPDAAALASVDAEGLPNVRVVLMRKIEKDSFVFFTNYESAKGQELLGSGKAAFVMHWKSLARQVRVRGPVEKEDGAVADAYFDGRGLISRQGAWASDQSRPLQSRQVLLDKVAAIAARYGEAPPRPPHWGGFRIRPVEIEFWADGEHRLHDRFRWTRHDISAPWVVQRLQP